MAGWTIGEVARRAGVNSETLRYYERRGLVARPSRTVSNYRLYPQETVQEIRFIKRAQALGFSLQEICDLLSYRSRADAACEGVRGRLEEKIGDIEQKIRALNRMRRALSILESLNTDRSDASG